MTQSERVAVRRVLADMVQADGIIDLREVSLFDELSAKYSLRPEEAVASCNVTLAQAFATLAEVSEGVKDDVVRDCARVSLSDGFCAREEALLHLALRVCLDSRQGFAAQLVSAATNGLTFGSGQILYIESEFDKKINAKIQEQLTELSTEALLMGFDFFHQPSLLREYAEVPRAKLVRITKFLYPHIAQERIEKVIGLVLDTTTHEFATALFSDKLGMAEVEDVAPSFMIGVGQSTSQGRQYTHFLLVEVGYDPLSTLRCVRNMMYSIYRPQQLSYLRQETGRLVYAGYYRQLFDLNLLRSNVRSSIVIDPTRERIYFREAEARVEGIHRREKALYALFLIESPSGGINFAKPLSTKQMDKYERRLGVLQEKYKMVYRMFGGEMDKAPDITQSEIRLPMISLLKKSLSRLDKQVYRIDDYIIARNRYGNYSVDVAPELCFCAGLREGDTEPLFESETWRKVAAL